MGYFDKATEVSINPGQELNGLFPKAGNPTDDVSNFLSLTSQSSDASGLIPSEVEVVEKGISLAKTWLEEFVTQDWLAGTRQALGDDWSNSAGYDALIDTLTGIKVPQLELISLAEIGANAAFGDNNTIYVDKSWAVSKATPTDIAAAVIEELGHYLDKQLNPIDTKGDEGAQFLAAVQGKTLSKQEKAAIEGEDDSATLMIENREITVERMTGAPFQTVPGLEGAFRAEGGTQELTFILSGRSANFRNEIGVFKLEDETGQVDGIAPGTAGYVEAVLNSASQTTLFSPEERGGGWEKVTLNDGEIFGLYLVQDGSRSSALNGNSNVYFSLVSANDDGFDHAREAPFDDGILRLNWEDLTGGGDQDFNDAVVYVATEGQ
ncbi:MAG: DUF4114 domain-containing protein, partial [Cyanobacteria bacterium P01_H01_bin.15]